MKSRELADVLTRISDLLRLYPNINLSTVIDDLINLKQAAMMGGDTVISKPNKHDEKVLKENIDKLVDVIDTLSITQIEEKLNLEELFPSMEYVRYFANKVGIDLTTRQSRVNSIHTIQKHLDRMRIDKTISNRND